MKKKIFIGIAILFALHFVTWKIWGERALLKKGFTALDENEECTYNFSYLARTDFYDGIEYTYTSKRIYISRISRDQSDPAIRSIRVLGDVKTVLGYRESLFDSLSSITDEINEIHQLMIIEGNWIQMNPYLIDSNFNCWVLGSDMDLGYEPLLIWAFIGWVDVANKYTYLIYQTYVDWVKG